MILLKKDGLSIENGCIIFGCIIKYMSISERLM